MRHYETILIVNPNLSPDDFGVVLKKVTGLIERQKGVVVRVEEWGTQKLAYDVKKFDRGTYVLLSYCGGPGTAAELEKDIRLDDRILKYQTVKLADNVDPEELVRKEKEAPAGAESPPAVQEAAVNIEKSEPAGEVNDGV